MKIRKKQNNSKICDMLPDFDDKSKECFLNDEEFEDLNEHILSQKDDLPKVGNFSNVDQLDIMDISVSNFPFPTFNKIELDSLDIMNDEDDVPISNFGSIANLVTSRAGNEEDKCTLNFKNDENVENKDTDTISKNLENNVKDDNVKENSTNDNKDDDVAFKNNGVKHDENKIKEARGDVQQLSKRALKRKQRLEESKVQCPVRTTARHYFKMFEFFESNPGVATGQLPKIPYRKKWRELTSILNDMRMGEKTTEKWQKTWSDYKLHLKKKLAGIKRSGKALDVPNQFTDQDRRALSIMGVCNEDSDNQAIKKRFNPITVTESEDSSSHSVVQSTTQISPFNIPSSTIDSPTSTLSPSRKPVKFIKQQRLRRIMEKKKQKDHFQQKSLQLQNKTLRELRLLKLTLNKGLNRIGDILQMMVRKSDANNMITFADAAAAIVGTAGNFAEIVKNFDKRCSSNPQI